MIGTGVAETVGVGGVGLGSGGGVGDNVGVGVPDVAVGIGVADTMGSVVLELGVGSGNGDNHEVDADVTWLVVAAGVGADVVGRVFAI